MPKIIRATPADRDALRPSQVFAYRLREKRKDRGLTQEALADMLTKSGVPMSKTALLGIERGKRGLSLDEAFAITAVLNAVPAHMFTPPEGAWVRLTDKTGTDALGFREFLRYGFPWSMDAVPTEYLPEEEQERFQLELARIALTLSDASRGGDKVGLKDAVKKLSDTVKQRESEVFADRRNQRASNPS